MFQVDKHENEFDINGMSSVAKAIYIVLTDYPMQNKLLDPI